MINKINTYFTLFFILSIVPTSKAIFKLDEWHAPLSNSSTKVASIIKYENTSPSTPLIKRKIFTIHDGHPSALYTSTLSDSKLIIKTLQHPEFWIKYKLLDQRILKDVSYISLPILYEGTLYHDDFPLNMELSLKDDTGKTISQLPIKITSAGTKLISLGLGEQKPNIKTIQLYFEAKFTPFSIGKIECLTQDEIELLKTLTSSLIVIESPSTTIPVKSSIIVPTTPVIPASTTMTGSVQATPVMPEAPPIPAATTTPAIPETLTRQQSAPSKNQARLTPNNIEQTQEIQLEEETLNPVPEPFSILTIGTAITTFIRNKRKKSSIKN